MSAALSSVDSGLDLARRIAILSVVANIVLALANVGIGLLAGSRAAVAAGIEFGADAVSALLVYGGLVIAARPPDRDHPYGHGRAEIVTGLILGVVLVLVGVGVATRALTTLETVHPVPDARALIPLLTAAAVKSGLMTLKFRVGRRVGSAALVADAWNDTVDILSAGAAITGLGLTLYNPADFLAADHFGASAIGLIMVVTGLRIVHSTTLELMDTMPPSELIRSIRTSSQRVPGVRGIEKCWARKTGLQYHVDIHVEVDPAMSVTDAHDIAERVRHQVRGDVPEIADVLVHIEPAPPPAPRHP
jgi:cation diffusion facilitator family transporter